MRGEGDEGMRGGARLPGNYWYNTGNLDMLMHVMKLMICLFNPIEAKKTSNS